MIENLHVAQMIDSLGRGGAESLVVTFAEVARANGLKVSVISLTDEAKHFPAGQNLVQLRALEIPVYSIASNKLYDPLPIFRLIRIFRKERFDVVQTHLSHGVILGAFVGWLTRTPVVATLHNPAPRRIGHYRIREFAWHFALKHWCRGVIAVSRVVENAYKDIVGSLRIDLILNPAKIALPPSLPDRDNLRRTVLGDPTRPFILSVGRLVDGKGLSELLTAFAGVLGHHPDAILVLAGAGELQGSLEEQAKILGVAESIRFLGMRDDIPLLLGAADIYISTSFSEGMSVALLEAMGAGLPIVATAVGEAPYLLAEGRGLLIPPKDVQAIENAMCQMLDNPSDAAAMGLLVQRYARDHCAPDPWFKSLMNVYFKAMGVLRL